MDVVAFVETWEYPESCGTILPGFTRVASLINERRFQRGRGHGCITVWTREGLKPDLKVEYTDVANQFVCVSMPDKHSKAYIFFVYFAPSGAAVYEGRDDPFHELSLKVMEFQTKGPIWVLGDLNSRSESVQGRHVRGVEIAQWRSEVENEDWSRASEDTGKNAFTNDFIQLVDTCGLTILNGSRKFPLIGDNTFVMCNGASVIDYLLATSPARDRVIDFEIKALLPDSDHRPLQCKPGGFEKGCNRTRRTDRRLVLDKSRRQAYEDQVSQELNRLDQTGDSISRKLTQVAKKIFSSREVGRSTWYDESCVLAQRALSEAGEDRWAEFRRASKVGRRESTG
ncbi:hypothetical protein R1sor_007336 [Riccia sorocarpa]|uniref:Endonuclease/exonuclease/phosphatase domain-containing protein n=1 Tax=Riccia sorocarpa TaxID=122646 RepID=A0ABD3HTT1_9MARC